MIANTPVALVTGGAGAIGSRLCARLITDGFQVIALDDLSSGYLENLPPSAEFVSGSICEADLLNRLFEQYRFTHVFHLAALFANQNSVDHPERDLDVNGLGTMRIGLEACRPDSLKRLRRLVYTSSSCVYGNCAGKVSETAAFDLDTPYAITKLLGEHYFRYFSRQYGVPVSIVRLFNSYGPGERPGKYRNVIPNFIWKALNNEPLTITGTGEETRDFTYIEDVVDGIVLAATSDNAAGETFNLATGQETPVGELARMIVEMTGSKSEIRHVPRRSWDHVLRRCGDISRARERLGYDPKTTLPEGLRPAIEWIRRLPPSSIRL
ncbi:MAG: UDP-glucose 4-epimerase [Myxococcota bacterium]|nr:UDP-glucose 4-epimerase [Myxococcota bacterium]